MAGKRGIFCLTVLLGICFLIGTAEAQPMNRLTAKEKQQGWILLFNGKNLDGWHSYLKDKPGSAWKVEDNAIVLNHANGGEGGDLTTNNEYSNFDLKLEWKISHKGNSGIIFDVHEAPEYHETYLTGPEMQVLDNKDAEDNKVASHLAGSLYDIIAAPANAAKPAEEWNKVRIRLDHGHLTFWMNGEKVVDTHMWTSHWNTLVSHSKFKNWKGFAKYKKGHIALQDHGHTVSFRNIKIRELE